jgi:hypothetical protein
LIAHQTEFRDRTESETVERFSCPKCGQTQAESAECVRCGIIFGKLQKEKQSGCSGSDETSQSGLADNDRLDVTGDFSPGVISDDAWGLQRFIPEKIRCYIDNARDRFFSRQNPSFNYGARLMDAGVQALLLILMTMVLSSVLIFMGKIFWINYIETVVGRTYIELNPDSAQSIHLLMGKQTFSLSAQLTVSAFFVSLIMSGIGQLFHLARYLYRPRGFWGRIFMWGLPLTGVVAYRLHPELGLPQYGQTYALALVPTLCLFAGCFRFAFNLLPELGDVINYVRRSIKILLAGLSK